MHDRSAPSAPLAGNGPLDVSIVLCTFRRPALLEACLDSLRTQRNPHGAAEVLVIDNCPEESARPVALRMAPVLASQGLSLRYAAERNSGVACARNRGLDEARHGIVAFIDDDEQALPGWLENLLRPFVRHGAAVDIVAGEVEPDFGGHARPDWLGDELLHIFSCKWGWDVEPRFLAEHEWFGEGNCAFRVSRLAGARFNVSLGRRGGTLLASEGILFEDLRRKGARAFFAPDARVSHRIHPERLNKRWVLQRMLFQGMSDVMAHKSIGHFKIPNPYRISTRDFTNIDLDALDTRGFHHVIAAYYHAGYCLGSNMY